MKNSIKIIAVDDTEMNLFVLEEMINMIGYDVVTFADPISALQYIKTNQVDIMLVDYMMPHMSGLELMKEALIINSDMLIVMITALADDKKVKMDALTIGASDFLTKPIDMAELQIRLTNLYKLKESQKTQIEFNNILKQKVDEATQVIIEQEYEVLKVLSAVAEYRDPETKHHIDRVAYYSKLIAKELGMSEEEQNIIFYASPLHDIGKIGIPDGVLLKNGKLTDQEFIIIKSHPEIGFNMLSQTKNTFLIAGAAIAKSHHEKWNGTGYPLGLKEKDIHLYGRITAVADVFDALTSERPYKKAWDFDDALNFLISEKGKHFDPDLVDLFVKNKESVMEIYEKFKENIEDQIEGM